MIGAHVSSDVVVRERVGTEYGRCSEEERQSLNSELAHKCGELEPLVTERGDFEERENFEGFPTADLEGGAVVSVGSFAIAGLSLSAARGFCLVTTVVHS